MVETTSIGRDMASRTSIVRKLRELERTLRELGATSLHLFGSAARDEIRQNSDVDIFIDYDPTGTFSLLDLAGLQQLLSRELGRKVDVLTRNGLHPDLRKSIIDSSLQVF